MFHAKFVTNCTGCWSSLSHTRCSSTGHWPRLFRAWAQQVKFYIFIQFKLYGPDTLEWCAIDLSANTIDRFFLWITTFAFSASLIWFCFHLFKVKELVPKVSKRFVKIILISFQAFPFRSCELVSSLTAALFHTFAWVLLLAGFNWWASLSQPWPYLACADPLRPQKWFPIHVFLALTCNNKGPT